MTFGIFFKSALRYGFQLIRVAAKAFLLLAAITMAGMLPFPIKVLSEYSHLSPIQKYWFPTYVQTEFSTKKSGVYRVLVVEGAHQEYWIAGPADVQPGSFSRVDGHRIPFILSKSDEQEGKRLWLLPSMRQNNGYLWELLRDQIYNGKSVKDIGDSGIGVGVKLTLILYALCGVGSLIFLSFYLVEIIDGIFAGKRSTAAEVVKEM